MGAALAAAALQMGMQQAGNAMNTGMGLLLEKHNDRRQLRQQKKLNDLQIAGNMELAKYSYDQQYELWNKTNYPAQVEQLKKAGLNPAMMYGMGGGGGTTTGSGGAGNVTGGQAPSGGGEVMGMMHQGNLAMQLAQIENIKADTEKKKIEAEKTGGVDTKNVIADTELKVLQQVIQNYAGKEAAAQYEKIKEPARDVEAKTYQDELEARQGIAGNIYELWTEGKLKEKSVAEIERILIQNSKDSAETRRIVKSMDLLEENIKGAKLDNIIKDLEAKLQTQTGIDRNSPGWLKILGRLFVSMFGGTEAISKIINN